MCTGPIYCGRTVDIDVLDGLVITEDTRGSNLITLALNRYLRDSDKVSKSEHLRYDLEVPVMVLDFQEINTRLTLPRVSPRLKDEQLSLWLQKTINKLIEAN